MMLDESKYLKVENRSAEMMIKSNVLLVKKKSLKKNWLLPVNLKNLNSEKRLLIFTDTVFTVFYWPQTTKILLAKPIIHLSGSSSGPILPPGGSSLYPFNPDTENLFI